MPAAYTTLYLVSGATEFRLDHVEIAGATSGLQNNGWAPNVAGYERSVLGSRALYETDDEVFTVNIGTHPNNASAVGLAMRRLFLLRDLADQWLGSDQMTPVLLVCQLQGTDLPLLQSAVEFIDIERPKNFADMLMIGEVEGLQITIRHRPWLGTPESDTYTPITVPAPALLDFGPSNPDPCVVDLMINGVTRRMTPGGVAAIPPGVNHGFAGIAGSALLLEISTPCLPEDNYFEDLRADAWLKHATGRS